MELKIEDNRITTGINGLDELLNGGYPKGNITLISGTPGTGKTIVCFQYIDSGIKKGDKCLYFSSDQPTNNLLKESKKFGFDFQKSIDEGLLKFLFLDIDKQNIHKIIEEEIKTGNYNRVVLDSLSPLTETPLWMVNNGNEVISESGNTFITLSPLSDRSVEGKEAPDFTVLNLEGEKVALKDFRGKWLLITFWQAKCSSCRTEMPHLQSDFESQTNDELVLLAINVMEKESFIRAFAEGQGLTFPILLDPVAVVAGQYKIRSFPTSFLIDPEGILRFQYVTDLNVGRSVDEVLRVLQALQSGELCPCGWNPGEEFIET